MDNIHFQESQVNTKVKFIISNIMLTSLMLERNIFPTRAPPPGVDPPCTETYFSHTKDEVSGMFERIKLTMDCLEVFLAVS